MLRNLQNPKTLELKCEICGHIADFPNEENIRQEIETMSEGWRIICISCADLGGAVMAILEYNDQQFVIEDPELLTGGSEVTEIFVSTSEYDDEELDVL